MDRHEAYQLLAEELAEFGRLGFDALTKMVGTRHVRRIDGALGATYEVEIQFRWIEPKRAAIEIVGMIDSSNCFQLERVEQELVVPRETPSHPER